MWFWGKITPLFKNRNTSSWKQTSETQNCPQPIRDDSFG